MSGHARDGRRGDRHETAAHGRPTADGPAAAMTHREVLEALSGLMLGMLVAILSSTVVSTSLPRIISDLGGGQSSFTWVVTATLLAMTVTTPIWGKLADLFDRKLLVQSSLAIFTVGSMLAGLSQSTGWLIACRVLQGVGAGGLTALVQVVMSDLISPRERGRYMGYLGAVMAVGTVGGPLVGGLLTDSVGWRWNFFVGVPVALAALVVLQRTLHLPARPQRKVHIDVPGAVLLSGGVALLLIWVSLAGQQFDWLSTQTALMVPGSLVLIAAAILVERRAPEPLIPLTLFRDRTVVLAVLGSVAVGVAMFGTSVFLSQYLQIARGESPTASGLLTLPMVIGTMLAATLVGRVIARTGLYKRWMLLGSVLLTIGLVLMGTIDESTSFVELGAFMAVLGAGVGMMMQNLVLVVQNAVAVTVTGAATALVAFFRSLAGATGVAALGAVLASRTSSEIADGLAAHGIDPAAAASGGALPRISELPPAVQGVVEHAYGVGVAEIFLVAAPFGLLALLAVALLRERPLGDRSGIDLAEDAGVAEPART
jgi:EmrB/QacA subfamily drug resistance transporter